MTAEINWLTIGKIVAPHGLKGEVKINPYSDFPERFTESGFRWIQLDKEPPKKLKLKSGRRIPGKTIFCVKFSGINDRSEAELLLGFKVLVPSNQRPKLKKGEFHLLDLLNLKVKLKFNEEAIGEITNLINSGNDLLEVKLTSGKKILIPFVEKIVPTVNLQEGWILIVPPPGLLEL